MRVIKLAGVGQRRVVVLVTLLAALFVLFFPARQLWWQRERIATLEERRDALLAENDRLQREETRLSDPAEVEALARDRLGLVRPGERAYFIEGTGAPETQPKEVEPAESSPGWWSRAWNWLTAIVRGRS